MNFKIEKDDLDNYIYTTTQKILTKIVSEKDKNTLDAIYRYCKENNIYPNIIDKKKLDIVLKLGITEYIKRDLDRGDKE